MRGISDMKFSREGTVIVFFGLSLSPDRVFVVAQHLIEYYSKREDIKSLI